MPRPFIPWLWAPPSLADRQSDRYTRFSLAARGRSNLKQQWLKRTGGAERPGQSANGGAASGSDQPAVWRRGESGRPPRKPPVPESIDDNPNFYDRFDVGMAKVMAISILITLVLASLALLIQWVEPAKKP